MSMNHQKSRAVVARQPNEIVILSEAKDLLFRAVARSRSFASLRMTKCDDLTPGCQVAVS